MYVWKYVCGKNIRQKHPIGAAAGVGTRRRGLGARGTEEFSDNLHAPLQRDRSLGLHTRHDGPLGPGEGLTVNTNGPAKNWAIEPTKITGRGGLLVEFWRRRARRIMFSRGLMLTLADRARGLEHAVWLRCILRTAKLPRSQLDGSELCACTFASA